ncbi:uncharacterized protein LOC124162460 [Ischnura elegans]|uniref:uncharacterized protein LOC124162460 n=1 Tax=Ischnura elegans TaxID=197161 RepID=UPI001ED881AB|nr:uncharacterized protein LOC124162460 [Ischnura elegans]XP_046394967.1 uncharacterized protein LOC124162460 [Ischnura elegans]XP_046394975.1 uncharacterized protein LOC124162460 [Ischnura elegans]
MDSLCGKEEEAMDCVLESAEALATSHCACAEDFDRKLNVIAGDESLTEIKSDASLPKSTDATTHYTELTSETISETIHQNVVAVVGANINAANEESAYDSPGSSTLSALDECNETTGGKSVGNTSYVHTETTMTTILSGTANNTKFVIVDNNSTGMKVKSTVDESSNDASCGGSAETATNINVAIKKSCTSSNDAVIGRITVLTINEEKTAGGKLIDGTERNEDALMACSDPAPKKETNDTFSEGINKYVQGVDLRDMKDTIPPNCEMDLYSDKSVQPSKKRDSDSHYDSEIEIIDCTSESLDGQPAGSDIPGNPSSVVEESPLNNTSGFVKMSGSGIAKALSKIPRNKKRERYLLRCENLRRFRMKRQLGEIIQPSQSKSRVSSHSLEKLTKTNLKFMENFDPKMSNRERRKMMRKKNIRRHLRGEVYGENGELLSCGKNLCDCMNIDCPGCHFPCPRCRSPKCGHECRVNRKWTYEEIEIDGTDIVIRPHEIIEGFLHDNQ